MVICKALLSAFYTLGWPYKLSYVQSMLSAKDLKALLLQHSFECVRVERVNLLVLVSLLPNLFNVN